jgi:hypothetical protein
MRVHRLMAERWRNRAEERRTRRSYGEWKTEHPEADYVISIDVLMHVPPNELGARDG